jgi:diacylglycerol kinase family enzyme/membrane-associated phospholipid phosphatase
MRPLALLERRLTRRMTRRRSPLVDTYLEGISEAANDSKLWLALAALIAAIGGRRGRRAAGDGVFAIAITSALVNGPLKLIFRRRRPVPHRALRRYPRTTSFPSGHAASAFAFATAATRAMPEAGAGLFPLATSVAYSRVYLGVHFPTDVLGGAAVGGAVGTAAGPAAAMLRATVREAVAARRARPLLPEAVLVVSPHAGNSGRLALAKRTIERRGIRIAAELDVAGIDRLPELLGPDDEPRFAIAAGGDGTVGAVAGHVVGTRHVLAIMPLGTGNDFARSLDIPVNVRLAAMLVASGRIANVDAGRLVRPGEPARTFVHAATAGVNVDFARLATRASVRTRLGRLTYLVAAVYALRGRTPFDCVLRYDGTEERLRLLQLSVINAPIVGGPLGLDVEGSEPDDHLLDVLVVEDGPVLRLLMAGLFLVLRVKWRVPGVHAMHMPKLVVDAGAPLAASLDGELGATVPGEFDTVAGGLRVLVPSVPPRVAGRPLPHTRPPRPESHAREESPPGDPADRGAPQAGASPARRIPT